MQKNKLMNPGMTLFGVLIAVIAFHDSTGNAHDGAVTTASPSQVINLLSDSDFRDFTFHLNPQKTQETERKKVWWINHNGHLHIGGKGLGYIRTRQRYRDYHCVLEYKWGERTWSSRSDCARACGLLLHADGLDGVIDDTWMNSIEADLMEGGTGDMILWQLLTEKTNNASSFLTAKVDTHHNGQMVWSREGESKVLCTNTRIGWKDRSRYWNDIKGFHGEMAIENPVGEWNRMEVVCRGSSIHIYLNGVLVNEGTDVKPCEGYIGIQSQFAECIVRRFELHPLDTFQEKWETESRSTDMGYSITGESLLPRKQPLSPEESQKLWNIDSNQFEMQLVAAEPITCDPVDVVWDEQGRLFVAEMGDYPTPASLPGFLSRIRLLTDRDGDGRMDHAITWADELDHVQGLLPMRGGLLATTRTAIIFLKDTDGNDQADHREVLYQCNEPQHNQLQISCPRWGLDNTIYLNNGLSGKEIHSQANPNEKLSFHRLNLRYDPYAKTLEAITGFGQFGASQDDFGRRFFCSNRNPVMFAVMPLEAVRRNPLAGIIVGHEDIQPPGAPVWPLALSHTTSSAHAGTHTSACGLAVYRADLMPELNGNLFVCDPTAQLITRNRIVPNGSTFLAERVGEKRDFLVSGDEWCRPVHVRNGPDGALYICDMYRRFIDHARFFPDDFQKTHYMRAGLDHGRIWRLIPKGRRVNHPIPLPDSISGLIEELESPVAWRRIHAQRLLVEQNDPASVEWLEMLIKNSSNPTTLVHAAWTLHGLGKLKINHVVKLLDDKNIGIVENAITLASRYYSRENRITDRLFSLTSHADDRIRFLSSIYAVEGQTPPNGKDFLLQNPNDIWMRRAFACSFADQAFSTLIDLLTETSFIENSSAGHTETLEYIAMLVAARGDLEEIVTAIDHLSKETGWAHFAVLNGFNSGLEKSSIEIKSLADLIARPPFRANTVSMRIQSILKDASSLALDRNQPETDRIAALPLVTQQGFEKAMPVIETMISPNESSDIQSAACRSLSRFNREQVAEFFFQRWDSLPPTPQREAIALMTSHPTTGLALMKQMKAGKIACSLMPPISQWSYGRSSNLEIKALAIELFGQGSGDRDQMIHEYRNALSEHNGDPVRGRNVFIKASCIQCHKIGEIGTDVGPSLTDVKIKPAEALLTDILDPNRAVEQRWTSAMVITTDGLVLSGLVQADDAAGVTLRMPLGVTKTISRSEIEVFTSTGKSLMPEGLERTISKPDMVDLISFMKQR